MLLLRKYSALRFFFSLKKNQKVNSKIVEKRFIIRNFVPVYRDTKKTQKNLPHRGDATEINVK